MNSNMILEGIKSNAAAGARLDFADLMARIEADGGKSTAPIMKKASPMKKPVSIAASLVLIMLLSVGVIVMMGSMSMSAAESEAPEMSDSACENEFSYIADAELCEPSFSENTCNSLTASEPEEECVVSDGDVSDSDVSDSDTDGEE